MTFTATIETAATINMNDGWEVLLWCREFGLTKGEFEQAVMSFGNDVRNLKSQLGNTKVHFDPAGIPVPAANYRDNGRSVMTRSPF